MPVVIPLGVDPAFFSAPEPAWSERNRDRYVLAVSRLHPKKNLEALIEAFVDEASRREEAWRLVIAGTGEPHYVERLQSIRDRRTDRNRRVSFPGWVDGARKRELIARASLFALASLHENFGVSVLEALASGVPAFLSTEVDLSDAFDTTGRAGSWNHPSTGSGAGSGKRSATRRSECRADMRRDCWRSASRGRTFPESWSICIDDSVRGRAQIGDPILSSAAPRDTDSMCGIAGGVFWNGSIGRGAAESAVTAMVQALAHRGPDGRGVFASPGAATGNGQPFAVLGQTRLAIIDVSEAGAQPMGGQNGSPCITYNGETYNFAAIKSRLEADGASFSSKTDTEVILRGYDAWGIDVLKELRGIFAFGLWDEQRHRLLIARDRLGIKPLYYFRGDGFFLFASEVRALLATGLVPRRLDCTALWQYLGCQSIPAPRTLVEGVRALEPARWMTIGADGRRDQGEYWNMLAAAREQIDVSPEEARRSVGELLRDAVAANMVSDVPVGAFLSGGIDSSAVVGVDARNRTHPAHLFGRIRRADVRRERARGSRRAAVQDRPHARAAHRIRPSRTIATRARRHGSTDRRRREYLRRRRAPCMREASRSPCRASAATRFSAGIHRLRG